MNELDNAIAQFLAEWAQGKAEGQNAAYLDRVVRERIKAAAPPPPKRGGPSPSEFLANFEAGSAVGPAADHLQSMLDAAKQAGAEEFMASIPSADETVAGMATSVRPADFGNGGDLPAALEELAALQARSESLETEVARAHDWRFHLESHCRQVHANVRSLLRSQRAPTKDELEGMSEVLRTAIGWAP